MKTKTEKAIADKKDVLATKEDLANVKVDIIRRVFGFFVVLILAMLFIPHLNVVFCDQLYFYLTTEIR